jgi:hypothetical protein
MLSEVVAAIAGGMVTGGITIFGESAKTLVSGKRARNRDLLGKWNCVWHVEGHENEPIKDHVLISSIAGEEVVAFGKNTAVGNYKLTGKLSNSYLMTFIYGGEDRRIALGGVVILELNATRDVLKGHWWQYDENRNFCGGTTVWEKA